MGPDPWPLTPSFPFALSPFVLLHRVAIRAVHRNLDSTFLGMIHEVVSQGDKAGVPVRVQRISDSVRRLFEELSMDLVLEHICEPTEALPPMEPLVKSAPEEGTLHRRILRAHDVLASLSEENRKKFQGVVDMLRKEMRDSVLSPTE